MKYLIVLAVIIGSIFLWNIAKPEAVRELVENTRNITVTPSITPQTVARQYVFVPYWSFTRTIVTDSEYSLIYFGVAVDENGLDTSDRGYTAISSFVRLTPNAAERILAVRMLDKNINAQILKNTTLQEKIAADTIDLAQKHGFDGVLLDYETSAFAFDSTINNITSFYKMFSTEVKSNNLLFYVTLYGDTYFQSRPFDVKQIGVVSDKVIVMTYDFSKSRGNPGPNFPLQDNNYYGYDLGKMITDYQKDVENNKLVIALGYFGYDWKVNEKGESITNGVPLSTNEIEQDFVEGCEFENCKLERNTSSEPSIKYTDKSGEDHIIWFEDEISAERKKDFLSSKGILEIADWAYSYN